MRLLRLCALLAAPALLAFAAPAEAGDCHCGPYAGHGAVRGGAVDCNRSGTCHVRDRCHPSTRHVVPRHGHRLRHAYGPWSEMRRHMGPTRGAIRRTYVRHYFLRRHPFCLAEGAALEEAARVDVLLAIGDEDAGSDRILDEQGRLDRGTARFHVGDYAGARDDFHALLAARPDDERARLGLALCAVVRNDWKAARRALDALATAGALRADDRFDVDSLFADASKLTSLIHSLDETVGYRPTDAAAHTVTAWLLLGQGEEARARRYIERARRWGAATPTRTALEEALGMTAPTAAEAPPADEPPAAQPPRPALHREIARADPARG